jgi:RsiW-degrading membrane proteinase PrsW (M82 family)
MTSSDEPYLSAAGSPVADPTGAPTQASAAVATAAAAGTAPVFAAPRPRNSTLLVLGIVGISVLAIILLVVGVFFILSLGPVAFAIAGIMALVPLAIVLLGVNWIDRWEPEPRGILVFAFLWGAGMAVVLALLVGSTVDTVLATITGSDTVSDFLGAVVEAPLVEETGKGLGVLIIFFAARKHFDSPIDGIVYAAWVAGGFAFSENILYFGSQLLESGSVDGAVIGTFITRGIMSPFAHVMFTACTGIALGIAARRAGVLGAIGLFILGLIPAMALHALWNGALFFVDSFFGYYAIVQFPLFVAGILIVTYLRRQESKLTFQRLNEYAAVGWFSPGEVTSLATGTGRRQARAWARTMGLGSVMKKYTRDATRLAFTRQRLVTGRAAAGAEADEEALLVAIVAERATLQAALAHNSR